MQKIRRAGYLLILLLVAAITTAFAWHPTPPARFTGLSSVPIPTTLGQYQSQDQAVDAVTKAALNSADIVSKRYSDNSGDIVDMTMIGGTDRNALHDPRSCLVGGGWKLDNDRVEQLPDGRGGSIPARTCTASLSDSSVNAGSSGYDILYVYVTHHRVIASATEIRMALLESALLEQDDSPVYFIRLIAPLDGTHDPRTVHAALTAFAAQFWQRVSPSMLKGEAA